MGPPATRRADAVDEAGEQLAGGTPLYDVTFVTFDVETTGCAPGTSGITEIGAVKHKGGECLGELQTLVDPVGPIHPAVCALTGITQSMVAGSPRIEAVLPSFLEFVRGCVLVGHNVRFDLAFVGAALEASGRPPLANPAVDTLPLARRLVRSEVENCRLATLAAYLRAATPPTHRALDDARATAEVLHALLEQAGTLGVTALDDLLALPETGAHPDVAKLKLVAPLPRVCGVFLVRDPTGRALLVGAADNVRSRVRSFFAGVERRLTRPALHAAARIDHVVCPNIVDASALADDLQRAEAIRHRV